MTKKKWKTGLTEEIKK